MPIFAINHIRNEAQSTFIARCLMLVLLVLYSSHFAALICYAQKGLGAARSRNPALARRIPDEILLRIVRHEDERRWTPDTLAPLLLHDSALVRRRATLATGRIGDERAIGLLTSLLRGDPDPNVRAMAAFALGEIESPAGASALLETLRGSRNRWVRARAIEALGKIAASQTTEAPRRAEIGASILTALEVERGLGRASGENPVVLLGLTAALRARPENASRVVKLFLASPNARVRADAANALARLSAKDANELLQALLGEADPVVRANAARALGAAGDGSAFDLLLARSTTDPDQRVRVSALRALAALRDARSAQALLSRGETLLTAYRQGKASGVAHPSEKNELLEIASTLGAVLANTNNEAAVKWLRGLRQAEAGMSPEVEIALARLAPAQYIREASMQHSSFASASTATTNDAAAQWQSTASLAQGLGEVARLISAMGGNTAISLQADTQILLRSLLDDPSTPALAVPEVLRALAQFKSTDLEGILRKQLSATDVVVRATAAELLSELPPSELTTRALTEALPRAIEDRMNDAALAIIDTLAKHNQTEAVKPALASPDHLLRRRAIRLLKADASAVAETGIVTSGFDRMPDYRRALARRGKSVMAEVATDKGAFTIELLPDEALLTVDNFVQLARRGFFNNIAFHRVVPNFVIQGGDPRGDGNGGPGYQIRCEINEVPYTRGAVGMALSGKDTGGSQWFVTHSPQPHLDGGYTVFGRVVAGIDTVDRIARGDRIRNVTVIERQLTSRTPSASARNAKRNAQIR